MHFRLSDKVAAALEDRSPVVALESTVISHGLPYPQNLETANELEAIIRKAGAVPATIAVFDGEFCVGLTNEQIEYLATHADIRKISRRDLAIAAAKRLTCATTVATTAFIASRAGIGVFSTGGIGGVHRGFSADVSADLVELARTPIVVVCSGPKIVLDVAATREWLETFGVTVLGWKTDEMPAFYAKSSGLPVDERVDIAADVAGIVRARDTLGLSGAVLVTVAVPDDDAIQPDELESMMNGSLEAAARTGVKGKDATPFLLSELTRRSHGRTLRSNIALLRNNASIAAEIASSIAKRPAQL
jgi:pseudouridine-5'-phosphate glycosidase